MTTNNNDREPGMVSLLCAVFDVAHRDATGAGPCYYAMGNIQKRNCTQDAIEFLAWAQEAVEEDKHAFEEECEIRPEGLHEFDRWCLRYQGVTDIVYFNS